MKKLAILLTSVLLAVGIAGCGIPGSVIGPKQKQDLEQANQDWKELAEQFESLGEAIQSDLNELTEPSASGYQNNQNYPAPTNGYDQQPTTETLPVNPQYPPSNPQQQNNSFENFGSLLDASNSRLSETYSSQINELNQIMESLQQGLSTIR